jgi:hypothetical protein
VTTPVNDYYKVSVWLTPEELEALPENLRNHPARIKGPETAPPQLEGRDVDTADHRIAVSWVFGFESRYPDEATSDEERAIAGCVEVEKSLRDAAVRSPILSSFKRTPNVNQVGDMQAAA